MYYSLYVKTGLSAQLDISTKNKLQIYNAIMTFNVSEKYLHGFVEYMYSVNCLKHVNYENSS
jgi:hypothetical protein